RERGSVKLPVRRQRKSVQNNNRRRHHVVGKPPTYMRAQLASIRRTTRSQNHIANKLAASHTARPRHNRRLRYASMPQQRRLDLPKLNAKTAHLNLLVRPTHKLQDSIPPPPRQRRKSPLRYIRQPAAPNRSATKRSAVSAPRPK